MHENEIERRLRDAVTHAAPNDLKAVLNAPEGGWAEPEQQEEIIPMRRSRRAPRWLPFVAAAMLAVVAFAGFQNWQGSHAVASVVSLDVNPSIQMQVNRKERVLSADPLNKEAWEVLDGLELQGTPVHIAVDCVVDSLLQHGYLEDAGAAILISVEDRDTQRAQRLETTLNSSVGATLDKAAVHSQVVAYDAGTVPANGLSVGKAALIQDIQSRNSALPFDGLAALSIEELWQLRQCGAPGMPIGLGNAAAAAEAYAGTLELNSTVSETEPELDETPAHYEVELAVYGLGKFDYKVDAYTGEILEGVPNVLAVSMPYDVWQRAAGEVPDPAAPPADGWISEEDAISIACDHAGVQSPEFTKLELDGEKYELEFYAGAMEYEYEIDARTGAVLEAKAEELDSLPNSNAGHHRERHHSEHDTCITEEAARTAALHHAGISDPTGYHCDTDWDDGQCIYEIEFHSGGIEYEYEIDGRTGAILKAEQDR